MRNMMKLVLVFAACAVAVAAGLPLLGEPQQVQAVGDSLPFLTGLGIIGMQLKIVPKTFAQLQAMASPEDPKQPEALPFVLYDSALLTSGTTTTLNFFTAVNSDATLSNMDLSGSLPQPQYFEIHRIFIDVLSRPSDNGAATALGQADDLALIFNTNRATLTFKMAAKEWGPMPARFCGPSHAIQGAIAATLTAQAQIQLGWRALTGGFPVNGAIVIPPQQKFGFTMTLASAPTLEGGNTYIGLGLLGVLHRKVS